MNFQTHNILCLIDEKLELISFNHLFTNLCMQHFQKKPAYRTSFLQLLPQENTRTKWELILKNAFAGNNFATTQTQELITQNDFFYEIKLLPIKDPKTKAIVSVSVIIRDITETQKTNNSLKKIENIQNAILEVMPDIIFINDTNGNYLEVIKGRNSQYPYEKEEIIGKNIQHFLPQSIAQKVILQFNQLAKSSHLAEIEYASNENGAKKYFEMKMAAIDNNQIVSFVRDITDRKKHQIKVIKQSKKLKQLGHELDSIVYKASHDLRSPIASILGLINVLKLENNDKKTQEQCIDALEKSVNKLDYFVQEIVDLSQGSKDVIKQEWIDFDKLIEDIYTELKYLEKSQIELIKYTNITLNFCPQLDKTRLNIILKNLIANALKFINPYEPIPKISINIVYETHKKQIVIEVKDNGIGIEQAHIGHIFKMFYRATDRNTGAGLGLYIVKEALKKMKGTIEVSSAIGKGTTFWVYLPYLIE